MKIFSHLEVSDVVLVHWNNAHNDYQKDSSVLYTIVPNKSFGSLLEIFPKNHIFSNTFNSKFQEIEIWFIDQNRQPLEINVTLTIK